MDIIDEEGNLFGAVNVIDALVVMLLAAVIIAGISLVWTGGAAEGNEADSPEQGAETPELEDTETTIIFRSTGQPDYVVNSIEEGAVRRSGIKSVEGIAVNRTSGGNTLFATIRLNTTRAPNGSIMWRGDRLFVGRAPTLDLESVRLQGTIIDIGESATLPTFSTPTPSPTPTPTPTPPPTPTPTPTPTESLQVILVQTTAPDYVADAIQEGNVSASPDIIAVREKTVSVENESRNQYRIELTVEIVATENQNQKLMYRGKRLVVDRDLRLDLGEAIVDVTVTDVRDA